MANEARIVRLPHGRVTIAQARDGLWRVSYDPDVDQEGYPGHTFTPGDPIFRPTTRTRTTRMIFPRGRVAVGAARASPRDRVTRPTPPEDDLFRAAAWVERNTLTVASIEAATADLRFQMKVVAAADKDLKGRRIAALGQKLDRLIELFERLEDFPQPRS